MHPTPRWRRAAALAGSAGVVAAMLVPVVASPAFAITDYAINAPAAIRVGDTQQVSVNVSGTSPGIGDSLCVTVQQLPGSTTTSSTSPQPNAIGVQTFSVTIGGGSGFATMMAVLVPVGSPCPSSSAATPLATDTFYAAGMPTDLALNPFSATEPVNTPADFTYDLEDGNGLPTYLITGENVTVSSPNPSVSFNAQAAGVPLVLGPTSGYTFSARNSVVANAQIDADYSGALGVGDTSYLTTTAVGAMTVTPQNPTTAPGGTTTFTISMTGAGGIVLPGVNVFVAVNGRNPKVSQFACQTGFTGTCTWSLVDAPMPGNTFTQDQVTFTANGLVQATTVTYGSTNPVGLSLATNSDPTTAVTGTFTAVPASGPVYRTGTTPFSVNTALNLTSIIPTSASTYAFAVRVTVAGTGGAPIANTNVTLAGSVSGSTGTWILNGTTPAASLTTTTNANGQAVFRVLSTKTGNVTWTATSGTLTGTLTAAYANAASDARILSVNPATVTMPTATATTVTGTVSDRYGNPVSGIGVAFTAPAGSPITFSGSATGTTNATGQVAVQITSPTSGTSSVTAAAAQAGSQLTDPANTVLGTSVPNVAAGVNSVNVPVTISAPANPPTATITSPSQGSRISSGGYFNVWFTTTNVPAGTMAYLTLDGRAKAKAPVDADGITQLAKIPAEPGAYAIRVGGGGTGPVLVTSASVSLTIIPFRLNGYSMSNGKAVFRVATGNFSAGTKVYLTRNGIAVAAANINRSGQAMNIATAPTPGVYQVRVNSNQGWVYGAQQGVITLS